MDITELIHTAYRGFNKRDIDTALATMHAEVEWPKAFEGGYVQGKEEIRKYWTRQWTEINPVVEPLKISERKNSLYAVTVHQLVKDIEGNILFDGVVTHVYFVKDNLLRRMDIETN